MKKFQQNMSLSQRNLMGVSIDSKQNNSDLSGNTGIQNITDAPTLTSICIVLYKSRWNLLKFVVLKHFG